MTRDARCPFDPPAPLPEIAGRTPIRKVTLWDRTTPWLVTPYAEQRALLSDRRVSADATRPGYPHLSEGAKARRANTVSFLSMDDPEHARLRRMVTAPFMIK